MRYNTFYSLRMPLPSSNTLWGQVNSVKGYVIEGVGGNIAGLGNYCAVRLSYAFIKAGQPIKINSDYKDKNNNKYIIKAKTF